MRSYPRAAKVALVLLLALPNLALAQASMPSAAQIEGQLSAPRAPIPPNARVTLPELTRRPDLRAQVPSIDIQSINFEFGSAAVAYSEYSKVETIAIALRRLLQRNPRELFLLEGHTARLARVLSTRRFPSAAPSPFGPCCRPHSASRRRRWSRSAMARISCWCRCRTPSGATAASRFAASPTPSFPTDRPGRG